jgi:hypothetical protein
MKSLLFLLLFLPGLLFAQAGLDNIGTARVMNFNGGIANTNCTAASSTWTDNSTIASCYSNRTVYFVSTGCHNSGGLQLYGSSNADRALGARASGSVDPVIYGVRFRNNTGVVISSLAISFNNEHWGNSNPSNANHLLNVHDFSYRISSTAITSVTAGTYTNGTGSLDVTPIQNTNGAGSTAMVAIPNGLSTTKSACLTVTLNPGDEIMLRWTESDNGNNDHNMGIDDLSVTPWNVTCSVVLPVTWDKFEVSASENKAALRWNTQSERMNAYFDIEMSQGMDGFTSIGHVQSLGDASYEQEYAFQTGNLAPGTYYFRLKQVDLNGEFTYSEIRSVLIRTEGLSIVRIGDEGTGYLEFNETLPPGTKITLLELSGRIVADISLSEPTNRIYGLANKKGMILVSICQPDHSPELLKIFLND